MTEHVGTFHWHLPTEITVEVGTLEQTTVAKSYLL